MGLAQNAVGLQPRMHNDLPIMQRGLPRMPRSQRPSRFASVMNAFIVSVKNWNSAFCIETSMPSRRFKNLLMLTSESRTGSSISNKNKNRKQHFKQEQEQEAGLQTRTTGSSTRTGSRISNKNKNGMQDFKQ